MGRDQRQNQWLARGSEEICSLGETLVGCVALGERSKTTVRPGRVLSSHCLGPDPGFPEKLALEPHFFTCGLMMTLTAPQIRTEVTPFI